MEHVRQAAEMCALGLEILALAIICLGCLAATVVAIGSAARREGWRHVTQRYRQQMARGILVGLEPLVAADIIHTVAVDLTLTNVGVLALIVVIRTFLSFALEVELTGAWPWQRAGDPVTNASEDEKNRLDRSEVE